MNNETKEGFLAMTDMELPIASIEQSGQTIRREMDAIKLDQLAQSMGNIGQLQRIGVYPKDNNRYELMYGQRRLSAATMLGWEKIKATIFKINELDKNLILSIQSAENLQTERLGTLDTIEIIRRFKASGFNNTVISELLFQTLDWVNDHEFVLKNALARSIAEAGMLPDASNLRAFMGFPTSIRSLLMETI